jgi:cell division septal protein FtsQ
VILGTHEKKQRLYRFVKAYNQSLKKDQASIAYVDMRYTTGMAVGWKAL